MNIALLAIKRPVFITCFIILLIVFGCISYFNLGLNFFPDTSFPVFGVTTVYPGVSSEEVEKRITKPLEEEFATISGIKHIGSENTVGLSVITLEFGYDVNINKAGKDIQDRINTAKNEFPQNLENDPVVQEFDPNAGSIMKLALVSDASPGTVYDIASETIKPQLERIEGVGKVDIIGGSRREIQVEIDRNRLNEYMIPLTKVVDQIKKEGMNVPIGKNENGPKETVFRAMGEFTSFDQISNTLISYSGEMNNAITVKTLGTVRDGVQDRVSESYIYYPEGNRDAAENSKEEKAGTEKSCIYLDIVKQSGGNTVEIVKRIDDRLTGINSELKKKDAGAKIFVTYDSSREIVAVVNETFTSLELGILLAVIIVFLFLGNIRSTFITAIAIPNSILGAIIMMDILGYTFNILSLLALSLVTGLLVDDAIVVRENIFRKFESGMNPFKAAEEGTREVMLAVIATTLVILSVFLPVGMMSGTFGKMFRQFGFTVAFAMIVSLLDSLTVAPFLSAYFAGKSKKRNNIITRVFERFQTGAEKLYAKLMDFCLDHQILVIVSVVVLFVGSLFLMLQVKQNFIPSEDNGRFAVRIEMPSGTSLKGTGDTLTKIIEKIKTIPDIDYLGVTVGNENGEVTKGEIDCFLKKDRVNDTDRNKELIRSMLEEFAYAGSKIESIEGGAEDDPFVIIVSGDDLPLVEKWAGVIAEKIKKIPDLTDVNTSAKSGSPEYQVTFNPERMKSLGVSNIDAGTELRYGTNGAIVGEYSENGTSYDIRARFKPEQRDIQKNFDYLMVPNSDYRMVPLKNVASGNNAYGSGLISKRDKAYIVTITANLKADGALGDASDKAANIIREEVSLPLNIHYDFSGGSEDFEELGKSIIIAFGTALMIMFLVLAALYESFITPFTIILAVPPALTGAIIALFITGTMLDIYSMIGMVVLLGLVTKNSILLVDNAVHGVNAGLSRKDAIIQAGVRRLRPILMTTFAMIAGMLPLAFGIGDTGKIRQSMGIAVIGGLIASTLITLIVVPAVFEYIDKFREATEGKIFRKKMIIAEK